MVPCGGYQLEQLLSEGGTERRVDEETRGRVDEETRGRVDEWTSGRMDEWTNGRVDEWTSGREDEWTNGRVDEWTSGRMDEWTNGRVDEWTSGRMTVAGKMGKCDNWQLHKPKFPDYNVDPYRILPRRGYMLVARGKATKERHPGLGMMKEEPSALVFKKKLIR